MRAHNQSNGDPADSVDDHVTATIPRRRGRVARRTDRDAARRRLGNPKHLSMVKFWSMPFLCFAAGGR
jgi:hypothetical protein